MTKRMGQVGRSCCFKKNTVTDEEKNDPGKTNEEKMDEEKIKEEKLEDGKIKAFTLSPEGKLSPLNSQVSSIYCMCILPACTRD